MNIIAICFFQVKTEGEKKSKERKEILARDCEKMAENEDELGLIGKPASLNNINDKTPSTFIEDGAGEVSLVEIRRVTSDGPPKKRKSVDLDLEEVPVKRRSDSNEIDQNSSICKRKIDFTRESNRLSTGTTSRPSKNIMRKNRSVEVIDHIDTTTHELRGMFTEITNNLKKTESPAKLQVNENSSKFEELQKLFDLHQKLEAINMDNSSIKTKIEQLVNEIN